jgi:hypothetical protein
LEKEKKVLAIHYKNKVDVWNLENQLIPMSYSPRAEDQQLHYRVGI